MASNQTSYEKRVQTAIVTYLVVFLGIDLLIWIWFLVHRHGPHSFPLGGRRDRFGDLLLFSEKFQAFKDPHQGNYDNLHGTLFPRNYPPSAVAAYLFLLQVCAPYAVPAMLLPFVAAVAAGCISLWRKVRRQEGYRWYMAVAIFATGFFGWGTEQVVMRANIEGWVWIAVCLGAYLYASGRYRGGAVSFGIACCLKPYPILWLALMARHRKYREAALGLLAAAIVTLGSLLAIDRNPLRAWRSIRGESNFFSQYIVALRPLGEVNGDHSIFQTLKTIARAVHNHSLNFPAVDSTVQSNNPLAWKLYALYLPLAALIGLVTIWKTWEKPVLNQIFALACITMALPLIACGYTLSLLLIPMAFFLIFLLEDVARGRSRMSLAQMLWFLLPCAWLVATEPLVLFHAVFKCVALLILLAASVYIPLPSSLFGELTPGTSDPRQLLRV